MALGVAPRALLLWLEGIAPSHPPPLCLPCPGRPQVSAAGLQAGLKSLAAGGAPPRLLIIDDGWQRTDVDEEYRQAGVRVCVILSRPAGWRWGAAHVD